jgi:hypothetical protein
MCWVAVVVGAAATGGCGAESRGLTPREPIARIGSVAISDREFTHWMMVLAPQHVLPRPPSYGACIAQKQAVGADVAGGPLGICRHEYQYLREQALGFLIASRWLAGEAAAEGSPVGAKAVKHRLAEKEHGFASRGEFVESLRATDRTLADEELEIQDELASERILARATGAAAKVVPAEVDAYYARNLAEFGVPEKRKFDIAENYPTKAAAEKLMREVKVGRSLAGTSLHEDFPRRSYSDYVGEKRIIYEDIFKAKPHILVGPIRLNHLYFVVEVDRISPAYTRPLSEVSGAIAAKLTGERRQRALASFTPGWRRRWIARTVCYPGFIVQKCSNYKGNKAPEDPLRLD